MCERRCWVEDPVAAAENGFAGSEHVVCEADTGTEIVVVFAEERSRLTVNARIDNSAFQRRARNRSVGVEVDLAIISLIRLLLEVIGRPRFTVRRRVMRQSSCTKALAA